MDAIQRTMPFIVTRKADWFRWTLGDQFSSWLEFRLAVLKMKDVDQRKWGEWMGTIQVEKFWPKNLILLNTISSETAIRFVPLHYDLNQNMFLSAAYKAENVQYFVPFTMVDYGKPSVFILNVESA